MLHTGTVTLTPVPEVYEEEPFEFMMKEIGADAPSRVPRARSSSELGQRMYDATNIITLLMNVPDFRRMAYVSADDMVADSWVSPEATNKGFQSQFPICATRKQQASSWLRASVRQRAHALFLCLPVTLDTKRVFL